MKNATQLIAALGLSALAAGCGSDDGDAGMLTVTVWGEGFIEDGIPAEEFADGWAIDFDTFLVSVGEVTVGQGGDPAMDLSEYNVWDLTPASNGEGHEVATAEVPAGLYSDIAFTLSGAGTLAAGNATSSDVSLMQDMGYAVYVEGSATQDNITKTFAWGFTTPVAYSSCAGTADIDGEAAATQLTIHGDHLFFDMLVDIEPELRFDLIASADDNGDNDGVITQAELTAVDITGQERYQVGSLPVEDLWTFIDYQVSQVGHIDGEGHCDEFQRL